ncbi:MAG: NUDIX domain-containing protein [Porticoccaceae bacterium]|nr:NUDIX domain-containing protein [Porticoccaceae bacterium]
MNAIAINNEMSHANRVVAALITNQGKLALFKRSAKVTCDNGMWHCITGFIDQGREPQDQVIEEIWQEANIHQDKLEFKKSKTINEYDAWGNQWEIHAFLFESQTANVELNWENDSAAWIFSHELSRFKTVKWLKNILDVFNDDIKVFSGIVTE